MIVYVKPGFANFNVTNETERLHALSQGYVPEPPHPPQSSTPGAPTPGMQPTAKAPVPSAAPTQAPPSTVPHPATPADAALSPNDPRWGLGQSGSAGLRSDIPGIVPPPGFFPVTYVKAGQPDLAVKDEAARQAAIVQGYSPAIVEGITHGPNQETKGDAESRHAGTHHGDFQGHRLSGYRTQAPDVESTVTAAHLFGMAQAMQAMVGADTTRQRQAIADAAMDGIDVLLLSGVRTKAGIAADAEAKETARKAEAARVAEAPKVASKQPVKV